MIEERESETAKKLDSVAAEHIALKARADTTFGAMRWIAVSAFGVLVTVILTGFTIARSAGNLEAAVHQQQKTLDQQQKTLDQQQKTLDEIKHEIAEIRVKQK